MKKIGPEDLKVLETYLNHALEKLRGETWENRETCNYIKDALAEIKRWKDADELQN